MGARKLRTLVEGGSFFEGPRWHEGRWWVSDFYTLHRPGDRPGQRGGRGGGRGARAAVRAGLAAGRVDADRLDARPHAGAAGGGRVAVSVHADLTEYCGGHLNDLIVDGRRPGLRRQLRLRPDEHGATRRRRRSCAWSPDGSVHREGEDLWFPNAMAIDGDTLLVGETFGGGYTAFTIAADGSLTDQRSWGQIAPRVAPGTVEEMLPNLGYAPDGMHAGRRRATCGRRTGSAARRAGSRPAATSSTRSSCRKASRVFACMLGGEDGRTLLLCAAPDFLEVSRTRRARGRPAHHHRGGSRSMIALEKAQALIAAGIEEAARQGPEARVRRRRRRRPPGRLRPHGRRALDRARSGARARPGRPPPTGCRARPRARR